MEGFLDARRSLARHHAGRGRRRKRGGRNAGRHHLPRPWDDGCDQRAHSGPRRRNRPHHHGRFRDLLEIGRQKRPDLYDLQADKPETLVSRDLRIGVKERVRTDGTTEIALDEDEFRAAVRQLKAAGVKSVAVCFLYSFLNSEHEARAARSSKKSFRKPLPHSRTPSHRSSASSSACRRRSSTPISARS